MFCDNIKGGSLLFVCLPLLSLEDGGGSFPCSKNALPATPHPPGGHVLASESHQWRLEALRPLWTEHPTPGDALALLSPLCLWCF